MMRRIVNGLGEFPADTGEGHPLILPRHGRGGLWR